MDTSRGLILKGAAGLGTAATAATGMGVAHSKNYFGIFGVWEMKIEDLAEKVGMKCEFEGDNKDRGSCTLGGEINIYKWGDKEEKSSITGTPKIKFEKTREEYVNGFKFTPESEITYKTNKKLSKNSTYEVKEVEGKWFLSKVSPLENEEIEKALGLPATNCKLPDKTAEIDKYTECENLNASNLKNINFYGKKNEEISGNDINVTLEIRKVSDIVTFPEGYKFTLKTKSVENIIIPASLPITFKKDTNLEFKIKKGEKLSLERAWTVKTLADKVGLDCSMERKECTIRDGEFDIYIGGKYENVKKTGNSTGKIKFEENQAEYSQGFKFTIEGEEISLIASGSVSKKLTSKETYEIKENGTGGQKKLLFYKKN